MRNQWPPVPKTKIDVYLIRQSEISFFAQKKKTHVVEANDSGKPSIIIQNPTANCVSVISVEVPCWESLLKFLVLVPLIKSS